MLAKIIKYYQDYKKKRVNDSIIFLAWGLRTLVLTTALLNLYGDNKLWGILTLLCFLAISFPAYFSKSWITDIPIEIEVGLFIIVVLNFVLGEINDFYYKIPYYDKFIHFTFPLAIGLISFLILYSFNYTKKIRLTKGAMFVITILVSIGVGTLWEIMEYLLDIVASRYFDNWRQYQGSIMESGLQDTMNYLILDSLGGLFAALLSLKYMTLNRGKNNSRLPKLIEEIIN